MATITVKFFASLRDRIGHAELSLQLGPEVTTMTDLVRVLSHDFPVIDEYRNTLLMARNRSYVQPGDIVRDGDEIALFPPVSGG